MPTTTLLDAYLVHQKCHDQVDDNCEHADYRSKHIYSPELGLRVLGQRPVILVVHSQVENDVVCRLPQDCYNHAQEPKQKSQQHLQLFYLHLVTRLQHFEVNQCPRKCQEQNQVHDELKAIQGDIPRHIERIVVDIDFLQDDDHGVQDDNQESHRNAVDQRSGIDALASAFVLFQLGLSLRVELSDLAQIHQILQAWLLIS